ncbi:hypothetical protein F8M41_016216 [Gigaspora margarita]|uniref:Zn(2)-C6 fungal-type domain-containing protein n=1 Tax=Gigaspora margarita TaxID=4874 RepID=A0A8H4EMV3_GIGMA|nr:hypothetical protein F8M41_016216 [Gigaspora margarita]
MDFSSFQISSDDCQMQCQEADHMNSSSFQFSLENYQERYQFLSEIHQDEYQFHLENYQKRDQGTDHISQLIYLLNEKESQLEAANAFLVFLQNSLGNNFFLYYNKFLESLQISSQVSETKEDGKRKRIACDICRSRKKGCIGGKIGEKSCEYCSNRKKDCSYLNQ